MYEFKNLIEVIQLNRNETCKGITFIHSDNDEKFISYNQLYNNSMDVLYSLQTAGVLPGQELVFQIDDNETFINVFWACILGRIIPVPIKVGTNNEHRMKLFKIWKKLKTPYLICNEKVLKNIGKYAANNAADNTELSDAFDSVKSRTILVEQLEYKGMKGNIQAAQSDDITFIQFSSGSTGDPKGVILTHYNLIANASTMNERFEIGPTDVTLSWLPLTHDMGMNAVHISAMVACANQYLMPTQLFIMSPLIWAKKAHEYKATKLYSANFGFKYFLTFLQPGVKYDWDLSRVECIFNGAEPISIKLCDKFMDEMAIYNLKKEAMTLAYGLAESTATVCLTPCKEKYMSLIVDRRFMDVGQVVRKVDEGDRNSFVLADMGYPLDDSHVRICDEKDNQLDDYVIGHIQVKGSCVTPGYYNDSEATNKAFTEDGWVRTGDLGFMWENRLVVTGRAKDIIFINAQNYYPHDIERIAEGVDENKLWQVAACGAFNEERQTEDVILFVAFKKGLEEFAKLAERLKKRILWQIGLQIDHVIPVKSIPKTTSGKVQRYKLAESYRDGEFASIIKDMEEIIQNMDKQDGKSGSMTATEGALVDIYKKVLGIDISLEDNFTDYGGNSMLLAQVAEQLDRLYPGKVVVANLFAYPTIKQMAQFIDRDDNKPIPALRIPEEYFAADKSGGDVHSFEAVFEGDLYDGLIRVARSAAVDVSHVLLSMYIYLLKEIADESRVTVQVLVDGGDAVSLEVDFEHVQDFGSFFKLTGSKLKDLTGALVYPVKDVYKARFNRDKLSIVPLFYKRGLENMDMRLVDVYDVIFGMDEKEKLVRLVCDYNYKRLDTEKIKELLSQYFELVANLIEKYDLA